MIRRALPGDDEPGFVESDPAPRETRPSAPVGAARGLRILVVEDNLVNQRVASAQLGRLGYEVDLAGNGIEALAAVGRQEYDLVFMDCRMPEMDGFEATRAIRAREGGGRRLPIVAMTANALESDREACLAVGMDDYISKPASSDDLRRVLATWLPADGSRPGVRPAEAPGARPAPSVRRPGEPDLLPSLDADVLAGLRALEAATEPGLLREVLSTFQEMVPERLRILRELGSRRDVPAIEMAVHSLKGSCGIVGARRMAARCAALERAARAGEMDGWARTFEALEGDWQAVLQELAQPASAPACPETRTNGRGAHGVLNAGVE